MWNESQTAAHSLGLTMQPNAIALLFNLRWVTAGPKIMCQLTCSQFVRTKHIETLFLLVNRLTCFCLVLCNINFKCKNQKTCCNHLLFPCSCTHWWNISESLFLPSSSTSTPSQKQVVKGCQKRMYYLVHDALKEDLIGKIAQLLKHSI